MTVKSHRVFLHIFIKLTDKLEFTHYSFLILDIIILKDY